PPGHRDLDDHEREQGHPAPEERPELTAQSRQRKQRKRGETRPTQHQHRRLELANGDLDEQVRDSPNHAHGHEEDETAPAPPSLVSAGRRQAATSSETQSTRLLYGVSETTLLVR